MVCVSECTRWYTRTCDAHRIAITQKLNTQVIAFGTSAWKVSRSCPLVTCSPIAGSSAARGLAHKGLGVVSGRSGTLLRGGLVALPPGRQVGMLAGAHGLEVEPILEAQVHRRPIRSSELEHAAAERRRAEHASANPVGILELEEFRHRGSLFDGRVVVLQAGAKVVCERRRGRRA